MSGVFVSYRRDDASGYAALVYNQLAGRFGSGRVFMDVDTLRPGIDYGDEINSHVGDCEVMIALIGRRWLSAEDAGGRRRLDDPTDWVRSEVSAALARNVRVIPVLVDGASVPAAAELPEPMAGLARREALQLSSRHTRQDLQRLSDAVAEELWTKGEGSWPGALWQRARSRWGAPRVLGAAVGAMLALAIAGTLALASRSADPGELRQFASGVDTILGESAPYRGRVSALVKTRSDGSPPTQIDRERLDDVIGNRRRLVTASRGLEPVSADMRAVRSTLIASFDRSLTVDVAVKQCFALTTRDSRRTCLAETGGPSNDATAAKRMFIRNYNRILVDLGRPALDEDTAF